MPAYCPYNPARLSAAMAAKHYAEFKGEYDLNIVGVRSLDLQSNAFNDWLCVWHVRANGCVPFYTFQATTDPGVYWRERPENVKGVAMMVPGQYRGLWRLGMHQGAYKALVQNNDVTVYRDGNKDATLSANAAVVETGKFGINCHRARESGASGSVDKWSAGCQVLADADDFAFLLTLCDRQVANGKGSTFTYTLLAESDIK